MLGRTYVLLYGGGVYAAGYGSEGRFTSSASLACPHICFLANLISCSLWITYALQYLRQLRVFWT